MVIYQSLWPRKTGPGVAPEAESVSLKKRQPAEADLTLDTDNVGLEERQWVDLDLKDNSVSLKKRQDTEPAAVADGTLNIDSVSLKKRRSETGTDAGFAAIAAGVLDTLGGVSLDKRQQIADVLFDTDSVSLRKLA